MTSNLMPNTNEMAIYQTVAKQAAQSKFYSKFGGEGAIMMIILAAREMNIPPMQALNGGINIIQGKVEIAPRMMSALIRKAGHRISVKECSDLQCTLVGLRSDTKETQELTFSVADAKKAGIFKTGGPWEKYPKDMCFARAMSRLARQLFADVIGIGYVEGEISQEDNSIEGLVEAEASFSDSIEPTQSDNQIDDQNDIPLLTKSTLPSDQCLALMEILNQADPAYKKWLFDYIKEKFQANALNELAPDVFEKFKQGAQKNMASYQFRVAAEKLEGNNAS